jgi:hypothetical protein
VYLGRSALEIKLREAPATAFESSEPTPVTLGSAPTERLALPAPTEPPLSRLQSLSDDERPEKAVVLTRSTLIGLCLTAFACGIVTTVALDRHHFRAMERDLLRAHESETVAATPPPEPVAEPAPVAPPAAQVEPAKPAMPATEPVVVQLGAQGAIDTPPAKPIAEPVKTVAEPTKPAPVHVAAARTPRPVSPAPAPARPIVHHKAPAPTEAAPEPTTPAKPAPATVPEWKDPFAE